MTLSPNEVIVTGSRDWDLDIFGGHYPAHVPGLPDSEALSPNSLKSALNSRKITDWGNCHGVAQRALCGETEIRPPPSPATTRP